MEAPPPAAGLPSTPAGPPHRAAPGLVDAAAAYLAARIELVRLETRAAARHAARRGLLAGLLAALAVFAWGLLLAGAVGVLAGRLTAAGRALDWHWIALALGAAHLLAALVVAACLARPAPPSFQATRAELESDRQWLADLKRQLSSKR